MAQRESGLSRRIIRALEAEGIFCFKVHGGAYMMAGLPDIIACVDGLFIGLEVKNPDGKSPTPIQLFIHKKIQASGGQAWVVRSVEEAMGIVNSQRKPG